MREKKGTGKWNRCLRCGYEWEQRLPADKRPVVCPRCVRRDWWDKRVVRYAKKRALPMLKGREWPMRGISGRLDADYRLIVAKSLWVEVGFEAFCALRDSRPDLDWGRLVAGVVGPRVKWAQERYGLWGKLVAAVEGGDYRKVVAESGFEPEVS